MTAHPAASIIRLELVRPLSVRLFTKPGAPALDQAPVLPADLADVASEAWRDGCLRAGHPDAPLARTPMRLSPVLADGSESRCAGVEVEITLPDGRTAARHFTFSCLRHVADRVMTSLADAGVLETGESLHYEVVVGPEDPSILPAPDHDVVVSVSMKSPALTYLEVPLRGLLERSEPVALEDDEAPPVFYTAQAFAKAQACARRGADAQVESGGALFGSLAACRQTGEFFSIIHDVVEVQDAEEKTFSLAYSSRSWARLQAIQQARQAAYPQRADRLIGEAHGHNFKPNNGKLCAECEERAVCGQTSAWASREDEVWHRAVFARQPWALCHIFGQSARGEPVDQLFGLRNGRLQPRGYYLLRHYSFD